ncbi:MAG: Glu-tRNA(Gln) amidotransferase subunit GatE [Candidatus Bathyarchaeota archaeon]|jgi:glutamyl-tRNA(Gln) amidotransferase subunit E|nr:Glu-tRNA(Gln) amidotransferase subunit GatE [Candidatus Bathyarchaeota archaeon A05DMB-5]MDH7558333.1 Glu-tRNA(Gln) amidotransferase subunit GatE [Candidatus Bathyarchaeota archaeon]
MEIDYEKIGLKVGLEIHQQLDTSAKLFCQCKPELFKEQPEITFIRRLRPTQSELGQVDPAAYFEFQKGVKIQYEANRATSCLVEMDEEPPHPINMEAVETALTVALMMKAKPVDEIHVMRKTVIDGSNTTGFQRTCVTALNGEIKVGEKTVPIQHISLEEDAARIMGRENNTLHYRIDRLGIPLIEIATAPVINTPKEAEEIALTIGKILRATGKAKRGLGTIRQDLNISITNGALIEIKGVQELELLPQVIEYEIQRQLNLIKISQQLQKKGIKETQLKEEIHNVTNIFQQTQCKVIRKALDKKHQVLAVKLPKFKNLLKQELAPNLRLGTEMADRARFWGRVGGIFHTDELPAYGITTQEVEALKKAVKAENDDAIVFVADTPENAKDALKAVIERAKEAIKGVPEETRNVNPDGTSRYMRPRPGAARMYPETDIPPTQITQDYIKKINTQLPELPEQKLQRLTKEYKLNQKLAKQIMDSEYSQLFETIITESNISPTTVAAFLTETLKALKREGIETDKVSDTQIREIFKNVATGTLTKEAVQDVFVWLSKHENESLQKAISALGLETISEKELNATIDKIIAENEKLIRERGEGSFGILMGIIMKNLRGKIDAAQASKLLKEKLKTAAK